MLLATRKYSDPPFRGRSSMKSKYGIVALFLLALGISYGIFARGPAVLPTMGISADEMKVLKPSQALGFNFSSTQLKSLRGGKKGGQTTGTGITTTLVLVTLLFIPFGLWMGVMRNLQTQENANISFEDHRESEDTSQDEQEDSDDDDQNLRKTG
jgi:hypothetical protein